MVKTISEVAGVFVLISVVSYKVFAYRFHTLVNYMFQETIDITRNYCFYWRYVIVVFNRSQLLRTTFTSVWELGNPNHKWLWWTGARHLQRRVQGAIHWQHNTTNLLSIWRHVEPSRGLYFEQYVLCKYSTFKVVKHVHNLDKSQAELIRLSDSMKYQMYICIFYYTAQHFIIWYIIDACKEFWCPWSWPRWKLMLMLMFKLLLAECQLSDTVPRRFTTYQRLP